MALKNEQLHTLKDTLLTMKKDLEKKKASEYGTTSDDNQSELSSGIDNHPAEEASNYEEQMKQQTFKQADQERLNEINDSLEQIEKGEYGICVDTGDEISFERLEAVPYAKRTVEAQQAFEENHLSDQTNEQEYKDTISSLADSEYNNAPPRRTRLILEKTTLSII